jgi:hypothetical protein
MKKPSSAVLHRANYYQFVLRKRTLNLAQMSRGELMEALMNTIDVVEALAERNVGTDKIVADWAAHGKADVGDG